jgi:hypothetical protein
MGRRGKKGKKIEGWNGSTRKERNKEREIIKIGRGRKE